MTAAARSDPFLVPQTPMTVGLRPISGEVWLEIDDNRDGDLVEKRRLLSEKRDEVWAEADGGARAAQAEAAALVAFDLTRQGLSDAAAALAAPDAPPLLAAALAIQEDLLLMTRAPDGWRLVAGSLSFPSSWRLREKLGRPLHEIHAPVPGFGGGARNASIVARVFDTLRAETPVERFGWSLYDSPALHQPSDPGTGEKIGRTDARSVLATPHLRVERQTLHKLPVANAVLFSVRIHVAALDALEARPDAAAVAARLSAALRAMTQEQAAYKRLDAVRDAVLRRLDAAAEAAGRGERSQ